MRKLLLVACLALVACTNPVKRRDDAAIAVYDLGVPPLRQEMMAVQPPLAIEVTVPEWIDTTSIQYRLAYADPRRLHEYAFARWAARPATLVQRYLVRQLDLVAAGEGGAACLVRIDIDAFSQVFESSQASHGLLHVRLALLDRRRQRLAEREFRILKDAPTADSGGGREALAAAVHELGQRLRHWQAELAAAGRLAACAPR